MSEYPYEPKTTIPKVEFEEFDGAKFAYMLWPSYAEDNQIRQAKARVLIVHGFGEYTQIYYRMMDKLSVNGFESFFFDQRGTGETSPGKLKGLTNERYTFNDLNHFISTNLVECKEKGIPLFLWGHSMGGGIVLNYACTGKHKDDIKSFIVSGPLVVLHPHSAPNKITIFFSSLLAKCLPNFRIDTGLDLEGITSDSSYRQFLANDPMSVPLYGSFRQIYDFLERGKALYYNKDNRLSKITAPLFIQHGKDDTINDPRGSQKVYDFLKSNGNVKLQFYENARHSILSLEADNTFETVFNDLVDWLNLYSK
ncbi:hypothetical protein TPHA_0C03930 [Tetrapisispora phaffii CBS 4417]|uniref:Serine aminopeptidase S33 domain-containing protein n=1 Tax=Tetrapisispora phaffii (strain ATCC 24235 / CBS 4417 / NBRC 1672 / NRRL Y-8282 / UCD 70-5) TaxID=1071381 RepID=G8BQN1_TETPH|nr:hypothetical protein TPHA_0C03930 [Tetrapisispora phaffii CBS 4417]CCE62543.1 hypothetical protein TPHA_0C03930 [Tetrapisispora phaffii CBS 4417]